MVSRFRNTKETEIKITKENGNTYVTCSNVDNNTTFMSVKILVGDSEQANTIRENFLDNPSAIYGEIINMLTKPRD